MSPCQIIRYTVSPIIEKLFAIHTRWVREKSFFFFYNSDSEYINCTPWQDLLVNTKMDSMFLCVSAFVCLFCFGIFCLFVLVCCDSFFRERERTRNWEGREVGMLGKGKEYDQNTLYEKY